MDFLAPLKGELFSEATISEFIDEELKHDQFLVFTTRNTVLSKSSEGERKKALLQHLIKKKSEYLVVDNVFGSLDYTAQKDIEITLSELSKSIPIIQITNRKEDILDFIQSVWQIKKGEIIKCNSSSNNQFDNEYFNDKLPEPYDIEAINYLTLIDLENVNVSYGDRVILNNISWKVKPGEFWKLAGPNGSGKSTMLSMIYGDNPKAYGQNIKLFDIKKGSGETVWDIKKKIGYYSADMVRGFSRLDSIGNMIVSGFHDSVGLYKLPSNFQINIAHQWLKVLGLFENRKKSFSTLSKGHQRLVLIARAMVKQPPLLILDEPTNGLDDHDAILFSKLINKIANETNTAIIFVSHRKEEGLTPDFIYELIPSKTGSLGIEMKI